METTISNLMQIVENSQKWHKTLWKKDQLPLASNLSFFHNVFDRFVMQRCKSQGLIRKGLTLYQKKSLFFFLTLKKKPFGNIVGKGKNAGNQHFLLFSLCFLLFKDKSCHLSKNKSVSCKYPELGPV